MSQAEGESGDSHKEGTQGSLSSQSEGWYPAQGNPVRRKCKTPVFPPKCLRGSNTRHLPDYTYPGYSLQNVEFFFFLLFPTDSNRNKILDLTS